MNGQYFIWQFASLLHSARLSWWETKQRLQLIQFNDASVSMCFISIAFSQYSVSYSPYFNPLTLILLTWKIWWAPNNANKWQMGFNWAFKGLTTKLFCFIQCVRKVAVHLYKVLEVMSTSVYTGLNPFNFIRKHFLQICVRKVPVHL
jgi:hypothetical protein